MLVRGIRGAVTVEENSREQILERTREMLEVMIERNNIDVGDIVSAIFSVTDDINAEFPAVAARDMGWIYTPLMCTREIPVPGSLVKCIRVLLHVNTEKSQNQIIHAYLYGDEKLRPDLDSTDGNKYYTSQR